MSRVAVEAGSPASISARSALRDGGAELRRAEEARAARKDFTPVPLGGERRRSRSRTACARSSRRTSSRKLEGSDAAQERVRHLHRALGPPRARRRAEGRPDLQRRARQRVRHRRRCSRSPRRSRSSRRRPQRSILFLAVTAEEKGLLGAKYYAENPLYPLDADAREHQHGRHQPVGPHDGHRRDRARELDARRRARARWPRRRVGSVSAGRRAGEGVLSTAPTTSSSPKQGVPALYHGRGRRFHRQAGRLRPAEARRVHAERLPQGVRRGEARLGPCGRRRDSRLLFEVGFRVAQGDSSRNGSRGRSSRRNARRCSAAGRIDFQAMRFSVLLFLLAADLAWCQPGAERARKVIDQAVAALGGPAFLQMQDRVETGRGYAFYRDNLSGLSRLKIYSRYLVRPEPPQSGFIGVRRERQGRAGRRKRLSSCSPKRTATKPPTAARNHCRRRW